MSLFYAALGVLIILATMGDAILTTLTTVGAGPITSRVSRAIWSLAMNQRGPKRRHRMLLVQGTIILLATIAVWILLLWSGWTLLFSADAAAVVDSQSGAPADVTSRIYFTGYTLFTLGLGNYVPRDGLWEILTAVASLNGLFVVTLSITYLIPVLSAANEKRQIASIVHNLGGSPGEILRRTWDGSGFSSLASHLTQLGPMIELHAQRHAAYPIVHYFHSVERRTAIAPNLAALDEALLLLSAGVEPGVRPSCGEIEPARDAIEGLLRTFKGRYISKSSEAPTPAGLEMLESIGIPIGDEADFLRAVEAHADRRRLLRAYVEGDGWSWEDVLKR